MVKLGGLGKNLGTLKRLSSTTLSSETVFITHTPIMIYARGANSLRALKAWMRKGVKIIDGRGSFRPSQMALIRVFPERCDGLS